MVSLLIASVVVASACAAAPQAAQSPSSPAPVIQVTAPGEVQMLKLKDGTRAIGRVESVGDLRLAFRTTVGALIEVDIASVASLEPVAGQVVGSEFWPADSNPTRLFFAPTGRSLKKGEAYFGVYQVLLPFVQYGVTDRFSIGGGTPLLYGGGDPPFWFTPKLQVAKAGSIEASIGVLHFVNMGDASVGIAYAVVTHGNNDNAATFGAGYAYSSADRRRDGAPVVMIGGEKRVSRRLKFVTENYWFSGVGLVSGGVRFLGERLSADLGLVSPITGDFFVVVPMINFVWKMR